MLSCGKNDFFGARVVFLAHELEADAFALVQFDAAQSLDLRHAAFKVRDQLSEEDLTGFCKYPKGTISERATPEQLSADGVEIAT